MSQTRMTKTRTASMERWQSNWKAFSVTKQTTMMKTTTAIKNAFKADYIFRIVIKRFIY